MLRSIRFSIAIAMLAVVALGAAGATARGEPKILEASMAGIPAGAPTLHGLIGGGAPWIIDSGEVELSASGRLEVRIEGLTLLSGVNPIATGQATVTCSSVAVATSPIVPFSSAGDAHVETTVTLPHPCLAPAVFFSGITGGGPRWFAVTGG